jgi:hypothetical protein
MSLYHTLKQRVPLRIRTYLRHPSLILRYRRDPVAMTESNLFELTLLR